MPSLLKALSALIKQSGSFALAPWSRPRMRSWTRPRCRATSAHACAVSSARVKLVEVRAVSSTPDNHFIAGPHCGVKLSCSQGCGRRRCPTIRVGIVPSARIQTLERFNECCSHRFAAGRIRPVCGPMAGSAPRCFLHQGKRPAGPWLQRLPSHPDTLETAADGANRMHNPAVNERSFSAPGRSEGKLFHWDIT